MPVSQQLHNALQKTVLITGAAGGIGRASVALFAEKGWRVIGVDRAPFGEDFPANGLFIQSEISHPESMEALFHQVQGFTKTLGALVNNAAVQVAKPLVETSVEEWDMVIANNLRPAFLLSKLAYPLLKKAGGGAIVNVSSVHAVQTSANIAAYATSKGGLLALTRAIAIEFAGDNIRVNAILPGAVDTPMLRAGLNRGTWPVKMCTPASTTWPAKRLMDGSAGPKKSPTPSISWRMIPNPRL